MATKIVGLDIGCHTIKAVVIESTYRKWGLTAYYEMKWEEAAGLADQGKAADETAGGEPLPEAPSATETEPSAAAATAEDASASAEDGPKASDADDETPRIERLGLSLERRRWRAGVTAFLERYGTDWELIYTALSGRDVFVRILDLPFALEREISQTLPFALSEVIPFDIEDTVYDYEILNIQAPHDKTGSPRSHILAAFVEHRALQERLEDWQALGRDPKAISLDSLALSHLVEQVADLPELSGTVAILDIGHTKSNLCVISGGRAEFVRSLAQGGADLTSALAREFELSLELAERGKHLEGFLPLSSTSIANADQEAASRALDAAIQPLVTQLRLTLHSVKSASKKPIERILLLGGGSRLANLPAYLSEKLGLPVEPFHYLRPDFNRIPDAQDVEAVMGTPLAIALTGLNPKKQRRLNMRKGDYAFKGDYELWRSRLTMIGVNLLVILLFFGIYVGMQFQILRSADKELSAQIAESCKEILGREVGDAKVCVSQMMEVIGGPGASAGISKLRPEVDVITVYDELTSRLITNEAGAVDIEELDISDKKIKLKGKAASIPTVGQVIDNIKTYACFTGVNQGPTRNAVNSDRVDFSLNLVVECGKKKPGEKEKGGDKPDKPEKADKADKPEKGKDAKAAAPKEEESP